MLPTSHRTGAGWGLAIVHRIAELHGGSVTVANCPDGGVAFTLRIPRLAAWRPPHEPARGAGRLPSPWLANLLLVRVSRMDLLNRAYSQLYEQFRSMTPGSRLMAGLLAAVALASLGYLCTHQAAAPDVDLMHGAPLTANQLPAIEAALGEGQLEGIRDSRTKPRAAIFVPRGQESDYMAALAKAKALPPNSVLATDAAASEQLAVGCRLATRSRDDNRQAGRPSAGNLQVTGNRRPPLVHLDIDKPGGFQEKVITALASVKPLGNERLDKATGRGHPPHVAGAVAGLKPENVTVARSQRPTGRRRHQTVAGDSRAVPPKQVYPQGREGQNRQSVRAAAGRSPRSGLELDQPLLGHVEPDRLGPVGSIVAAVDGPLQAVPAMPDPTTPAEEGTTSRLAPVADTHRRGRPSLREETLRDRRGRPRNGRQRVAQLDRTRC